MSWVWENLLKDRSRQCRKNTTYMCITIPWTMVLNLCLLKTAVKHLKGLNCFCLCGYPLGHSPKPCHCLRRSICYPDSAFLMCIGGSSPMSQWLNRMPHFLLSLTARCTLFLPIYIIYRLYNLTSFSHNLCLWVDHSISAGIIFIS